MARLLHTLLAALIFCAAFAASPLLAEETASEPPPPATPAQEEAASPYPNDLSSPRATIHTFVRNMGAPGRGEDGGWRPASVAFDLSRIPALGRDVVAEQAATGLYEVFNRLEWIDFTTIPEQITADTYTYRFLPSGAIELRRQSDGKWRFTHETLERIPSFLVDVAGRQVVDGLQATGFISSPAVWFRTHLPGWVFERSFILENFQWFGLLIVILLGVIADRIVRFAVGRAIGRWLRFRGDEFSQEDLDSTAKWIGLTVAGIIWAVMLRWLALPEELTIPLRFGAIVYAVFSGVTAALKATDLGSSVFEARARRTATKFDDILVPLLRKAVKLFILAIGIIFIADNMAIDVTSLLAGLGIGGLAFALAAKDTIENIFGSVTILLDRPFQIGDWVNFNGVDGSVEAIGLRSTRVRTFYDSVITVPNSNMIKANIDNYGLRRYRRYRSIINITYNTPPEKIEAFCEGIRELIRQHPYTRKDYYMVYLNEFGAHSLDILLYTFFRTPDWATELRERHRLMVDIVRLANRIGVEFAFPTQTLYLERGNGPAQPNADPFLPYGEIENEMGQARHSAEELMRSIHRAEGAPYPPPPVRFDFNPATAHVPKRGGDAGS